MADGLSINLNLTGLSSTFARKLQHMLDVLRVLEVGVSFVTQEQVAEAIQFMSFQPANGAQLGHDEAKQAAQNWLLSAFLRDAIEATGLFLDECLRVCALIQLAAKRRTNGAEINQVLNVLPQKIHKLHFPDKITKLERDFGVHPAWSDHVLALNKARTCVTHRLGYVSKLDVDESQELVITLRTMRMVAREIGSGKELLLDRPGLLIEADSMVEMSFVEHIRRFPLGQRIELTHFELYSLIVTLWSFATSCSQEI